MKKNITLILSLCLVILTATGCGRQTTQSGPAVQTSSSTPSQSASSAATNDGTAGIEEVTEESGSEASGPVTNVEAEIQASSSAVAAPETAGELTVHFGDDGVPFTMHLYDNSTAQAIADYVGTADWRLPIYNYDNYDNWEVMQYYDLPSRYNIPSNMETVTAEKAGEVYYSEPNRIVLFYGDAEITGAYSRVGYFDATSEFINAVQDNPVLEGWGNKVVLIQE